MKDKFLSLWKTRAFPRDYAGHDDSERVRADAPRGIDQAIDWESRSAGARICPTG